MRFSGLENIVQDWSTASSSVLTNSSEENDYSDRSDDFEEVKNELLSEEMSTSSKGTAGWLQKHHILKPRKNHAEAKGMSAGDKASAKGKAKRKHAAKSDSSLERTCISADGGKTTKSKLKRKNSSNRSLSSIIKARHRSKDHQYTPKRTKSLSGLLNRGAARFSPPPVKRRDEVVPIDAGRLCGEVVDDIFDSMYFFRCLVDGVTGESLECLPQNPQQGENKGGGFKEESPGWLPWQTRNEDKTNISTNDASTIVKKGWLPWQTGNEDNTNVSTNDGLTMKSEDHAYYLSRSATAASF